VTTPAEQPTITPANSAPIATTRPKHANSSAYFPRTHPRGRSPSAARKDNPEKPKSRHVTPPRDALRNFPSARASIGRGVLQRNGVSRMRKRPSTIQIGAVVLAVVLTGSYVWFKSAQAQEQRSKLLPGLKSGRVQLSGQAVAGAPTTAPSALFLPGSKSSAVFVPQSTAATTAPSATTLPLTVIYSSKSAPVDFSGAIPRIPGMTLAPTTQPAPSAAPSPATRPAPQHP
jgi:hypothetical protein